MFTAIPAAVATGAGLYEMYQGHRKRNYHQMMRGAKKAFSGAKRLKQWRRGTKSSNIARSYIRKDTETRKIYSKKYKRRLPYKLRRRIRKFKRRVRKIIYGRSPLHTLYGRTSTTCTIGTNPGAYWTINFDKNDQGVIGNSGSWGCYLGEQWGTGYGDTLDIFGLINRQNRVENNAIVTNSSFWANYLGFYSKYMTHTLTIKNQTSDQTVVFDLYTCVAAQDIADSAYQTPQATMVTINGNQQFRALSLQMNLKGTTPLDYPEFGKYWKITGTQRVVLAPFGTDRNQTKTFEMKCKPTFVRSADTQGKYALKGKTFFWMIIMRPQLDNDATANIDGIGMSVDIVKRWHYRVYNDANGRPDTQYSERTTITTPAS